MSLWTFLTTGAVGGIAGWGGKWLQSWFDSTKQRRDAIEDQVLQHIKTFAPKYDLIGNHAYLLANALVGYLNSKMDVQLAVDAILKKTDLEGAAVNASRESLFFAAKFYRTISELFWVEGAKYYLPDVWAGQTMQDLHNQIVARLHIRLEYLSPFLKDKTLVGDFSKMVELAKGKEDSASKALNGQVEEFRAWLTTNDREVRELVGYLMAYAGLFEQQMGTAWAKKNILPHRRAAAPLAPEMNDDVFTGMAGTNALVRIAEKKRVDNRKSLSELVGQQGLRFYELFGRGWSAYMSKDYAQAFELFESARRENPKRAETLNNMANVRVMQGNFADAEKFYTDAVNGEDLDAHTKAIVELNFAMMWSQKAATSGQSEKEQTIATENAIKHCKAATDLSPTDYLRWNQLGNFYSDNHLWAEAENAYRVASEIAPNDPVIHANWGEASKSGNRPEMALLHFEDAVARVSPGETGKEVQKADYYTRIAELFAAGGDLVKVREYRRLAMDSDCTNSGYLLWLESAYSALNQSMPGEEFRTRSEVFRTSTKAEDHFMVGRALFLRNDFLGAQEEFDKSLRLDPDNAAYHFYLGKTRRQLQLPDMAAASYQRALNHDPQNGDYRRSLGLALQAAELYEEALGPLEATVAVKPSDTDCLFAIALCHAFGKGNDTEQAISVCNRAIAADPGDYRAHECLGIIQRAAGHLLDALREYAEAFSKCTDSEKQKELLHPRREVCDELLGHDPDALIHDPNYPDLLNESGEIFQLMGRREEAIAAYEKASDLGRRDARTEQKLAQLRGDTRYQQASETTDDATKREKLYRDAIKEWEAALAGDTVPYVHAKLLNNIGTAYDALGERDEALTRYRQSAELEPNAPVARYNFAGMLYRRGVFVRALAEFEESYRLGRLSGQAPYQIGNCYAQLDRWELAKANWEEACQLNPNYPEPLSNLGVFDYLRGNKDAAKEKWQRAIQLNSTLKPTVDMFEAIEHGKEPKLAICESHDEAAPRPAADQTDTATMPTAPSAA
ncbi:MAG: tetratricopeptide repeat protein [Terracidiphilus sp.]